MRALYLAPVAACALLAAFHAGRYCERAAIASAAPDATYSLLADYPDGREFGLAFRLSADACGAAASRLAKRNPTIEYLCAPEGGE